MICPKCGKELEEGKLLCENCGEEVKIVPDFDIELEHQLEESINAVIEEIAAKELAGEEEDKDTLQGEEDSVIGILRGYFSKRTKTRHRLKIAAIILVLVITVFGIAAMINHSVEEGRYNSFDYQYEQAVAYAAQENYADAISHLERALAIDSEDLEVRFLLAKYYEKNGQQKSALVLLQELLDIDTAYEHRDEVYDMLLGIYEKEEKYIEMGNILKDCDVSRIVSKYNKYAAFPPKFNKQGGTYDELISITLAGNTQGIVYYTMDGSVPTENSAVYETPILLEAGDYTIRAMFVNKYGMESDIVTQNYYIDLAVPEPPVVNPDSGTYIEPRLIAAYHDGNTKIYYMMDGSVPDKYSNRYTGPIEMPYGISNFSFIAINEAGVSSEVARRTYHLEITANFDTELALQVLKNNLCAEGILLNVEGNVPNKLGINMYQVRTLYKTEEAIYYIVYEEYMDTLGKTHDTNNIYAIDAATADLYVAYKVDEGKYNLQPFKEAVSEEASSEEGVPEEGNSLE